MLKIYPRLVTDSEGKPILLAPRNRAEVVKFATSIQNNKEGGPNSPEELLKLYYSKIQESDNSETEFDHYVNSQFLIQTNYILTQTFPKEAFVFIGYGKN